MSTVRVYRGVTELSREGGGSAERNKRKSRSEKSKGMERGMGKEGTEETGGGRSSRKGINVCAEGERERTKRGRGEQEKMSGTKRKCNLERTREYGKAW